MVYPQSPREHCVWEGGVHRRGAAPNQALGCAHSRNGPLVWKTGQSSSCDFPPISSRCLLKASQLAKGKRGTWRWISGGFPTPISPERYQGGLRGLDLDVLGGGSGSRNAGGRRGGAASFQWGALSQPRLLPPTQQVC